MVELPDTPRDGEPASADPPRGRGVRIGRTTARHHHATAPVRSPAGQARTWLSRRLDRLVAAGYHRFGRRVSRYRHRYREHVLAALRPFGSTGLVAGGPVEPDVHDVAVGGGAPAGGARRHAVRDLLGAVQPAVLAVLGGPGSGKTTLLRQLARRIAQEPPGRRPLPVLVELRDHGRRLATDPATTLPTLLRSVVPGLPAEEPPGFWDEELWRGRCVVLFDGLDEVTDPETRRAVAGWLDRQLASYPGNDYVITSRPHGYRTAVVGAARVLQLGPLTDAQVTAFLNDWYRTAERHAARGDGADGVDAGGSVVDVRARRAAAGLRQRLAAVPALDALAGNPLLLTMIANVSRYRDTTIANVSRYRDTTIANVSRYRDELPGTRVGLYAEVCRVLLRRWEEAHPSAPVPAAGAERLLGRLAFAMMRQRVGDLPRAEMLRTVGPALGRVSAALSADAFLDGIVATGLLVGRGGSGYAFAHHTFQEYLAARHVRDNGLGRVLVGLVDDVWWRETILLYAAGAGSDVAPIVRACLDSGGIPALSLAFDCAEHGAGLPRDLRVRLDRSLTGAFDAGSGTDRRRLAAGVLAARYLREVVPTGQGTFVCARPVTTDLYALFLRDTGTPPPDGGFSPDPDAGGTVTGMWGGDAVAFVDWINAVAPQRTGARYRLPTAPELHALAAGSGAATVPAFGALGAWSAPGPGTGAPESEGGAPVPWVPGGTPASDVVTGTDLLTALTADVTGSGLAAGVLRYAIRAMMAAADRLDDTGLPIAPAGGLEHHLTRAQELAFALGRTLAPAHTGGLAEARTSAVELASSLGDALEHAAGYAAAVDRLSDSIRELRHDVARRFAPATAAARAAGFGPAAGPGSGPVGGGPAAGPGLDLSVALGPAGGSGELRRAVDLARALADACAHGQRRACLVVEAVGRTRAAASALDHEIDVIRVDADVIHIDLLQIRERPLAGMRQHATVQARELARRLDAAYQHAVRTGDGHATELARTRTACLEMARRLRPAGLLAPILGTALLEALLAVVRRPGGHGDGDWSQAFVDRLLRTGGIAITDRYPIRLDTLAGTAARACSGITALAAPDPAPDAATGTAPGPAAAPGDVTTPNGVTAWAVGAARRLLPVATAVFARRRPVTPRLASEIRVSAIALAAEAGAAGRSDLADAFRTVAAGATLLRRRAERETPFEALLLARA